MAFDKKYIKRPQIDSGFYISPDTFSFKDLLAIFFTLGFFYACYRALTQAQALELVKSITYLMAIILGGYFGHEITAAIIHEKYRNNNNSYNYGHDYGYNYEYSENYHDGEIFNENSKSSDSETQPPI